MLIGNRQFEPERAVEVTKPKYGSAYRIGGSLVLTAAHLVTEVGSDCRVRAKQHFGEAEAKVVWKAEQADIALVELPKGIEPREAVVFGLLPKARAGERLEFQMYCWPAWARTKREQGRSAAGGRQIEGRIYLADMSPDSLLVLEAERLPPEGLSGSGSEWEGASGAAVVCDGLVIAVQMQHQNPQRAASLEATPLWIIYNDKQWCDLLKQHGINPEPALAHLKAEIPPLKESIPANLPRSGVKELNLLENPIERKKLIDLLKLSGRTTVFKRETLCDEIGINIGEIPQAMFLADEDFAKKIIKILLDRELEKSLCQLCKLLEQDFPEGRYFNDLREIKTQLNCE